MTNKPNIRKRVGLAVMRVQPLHLGHCLTINRMIQECETVIIGLGSTQKKPDEHDPFTPDVRQQMLKNVWGDRIKIVPLNDIGAGGPDEWMNYVLEKVSKLGMADPTDYYTGSISDSYWYRNRFYLASKNEPTAKIEHYNKEGDLRILHIVDREKNEVPTATEIRNFIKLRTDDWMQWVPRINIQTIYDNYPEEFKIPIK